MRKLLVVMAALGGLSVSVAWAAGTITFDQTLITIGDAPTRGRLVLRTEPETRSLPEIAAPAEPGDAPALTDQFTSASTTLPSHGGGDDALHLTTNTTLQSGTYDVSTFTVDAGVLVHCAGPVTIRTSGDALVEGSIQALGSDAHVILLCDGDFTARAVSGFAAPSMRSGTRLARMVVDALGDVTISGRTDGTGDCEFYGSQGVLVSARSVGTLLDVANAEFSAGPHGVYLRSEGDIVTRHITMTSSGGGMNIAAFGGDATVFASDIDTGSLGLRLLASGSFGIGDGSSVITKHVTVRAESGSLKITDDSLLEVRGTTTDIRVGDDVIIEDDSRLRHVGGGLPAEIVAEEGSLRLGPGDARLESTGSGAMIVRVGEDVSVGAGASISAVDGDIELHAARDVDAEGDVTSRFGAVTVRAGRDLAFSDPVDAETEITGAALALAAGGDLELTSARAKSGALSASAGGSLRASGAISAAQSIDVVALAGSIDVGGSAISTSPSDQESGSIRLETWAGDAAPIDLTAASLSTGTADATSGNILILVSEAPPSPGAPSEDDGKVTETPPGASEEFPLELLRARAKPARRDTWRIRARWTIALDADPVDLDPDLAVTIGSTRLPVSFTKRARRGVAVYKGDGVTLRVRPAAEEGVLRFDLTAKPALGDALSGRGNGTLDVVVSTSAWSASTRVELQRGRFRADR